MKYRAAAVPESVQDFVSVSPGLCTKSPPVAPTAIAATITAQDAPAVAAALLIGTARSLGLAVGTFSGRRRILPREEVQGKAAFAVGTFEHHLSTPRLL